MKFFFISIFLTINIFGQKIKVSSIQSDSIYISIENNTDKAVIIYPDSFILKLSLIDGKGNLISSNLESRNPKNHAFFQYRNNKEKVDSLKKKYDLTDNEAILFWYIEKNKIIIPKKSRKTVHFLLYSCLMGKFFNEKYYSEKLYMTGQINFLYGKYLPEEYTNKIKHQDFININEINFCKIPIKNPKYLFCDKELD